MENPNAPTENRRIYTRLYIGTKRLWSGAPPWLPFLFFAFFLFVIYAFGIPYMMLGPNPDYSALIARSGKFEPHHSAKSPYDFLSDNGSHILLSCEPRMLKNFCIDNSALESPHLEIEYYRFNSSILRSTDGVIISAKDKNSVLMEKQKRISDLKGELHKYDVIDLILDILFICAWLPVIMSIILISIGMFEAMKRIGESK